MFISMAAHVKFVMTNVSVAVLLLLQLFTTKPYGRVRVGRNLSDRFPIRNGLKQVDALSPLLFNFALEYVIRRVQLYRMV